MLKPVLFLLSALAFVASPAFAAVKAPVKMKEQRSKPAASTAVKEEKIDSSLAELNALIQDSSLSPRKDGKQALLEDFEENLELSENKATITTDDLAKKGGLQEMSSDTLAAPETELE